MIEQLSKHSLARTFGRREIIIFAMGLGLAVWPLALPAQSVTLAWNASTNYTVTGYLLSSGTDGIDFDDQTDAGTNTIVTVTNVTPGLTNYFEVQAYDASYDLSPPSQSVSLFITNPAVVSNPPGVTNNGQSPGTNAGVNPGGNTVVGKTNFTYSGTLFALFISGDGTLAPSRTLEALQEGKEYTLTATPAKGSVFADWSSNGVVVATTPKYTFLVESNEILRANFVTNPFIPVMGTYHGLFYVTSNAAAQSSGYIVATVTSAGAYSAKLSLGAQSHSFNGQFSVTGASSKSIERPGLSPFIVQLQLGSTNGPMTGTIGDGDWTADLMADPAVYSRTNPAPQAGKYTLVIPGADNVTSQPGGNGFGALTVSDLGNVTFSGTLGDGTPVTAMSTVSGEGQWPLYVSLYGGKGSILGWLSFTNEGVIGGQLGWFKLSEQTARVYPGGFTNNPVAVGSAYHFTKGLPVLGFANGLLSLTNGSLQQGINNQVVLDPAKKEAGQNNDSLTFTTSSGLFKGSVMNPETGKPIAVKGVVLQNQNFGAGFFLSATGSGSVVLSQAQ
jgi:hypothetical protein